MRTLAVVLLPLLLAAGPAPARDDGWEDWYEMDAPRAGDAGWRQRAREGSGGLSLPGFLKNTEFSYEDKAAKDAPPAALPGRTNRTGHACKGLTADCQ